VEAPVNKLRLIFLLIVALAALVPFADAKGLPDLILLSGGRFAHAIEITDRSTLNGFSPWGGQFAAWNLGAVSAPCSARSFDTLFYMKQWPQRRSRYDRGSLKMVYGTRYCQDGNSGYVYLPGRGEQYFDENNGTMMLPEYEGHWYHASAAWQALMTRLLEANSRH